MSLGVFVSRCAGEVDGVIDVDAALADVRDRASVVRVFDELFDPEVTESLIQDVRDHGLDSVVLAGNSPVHFSRSMSAGLLRDALVDAGVNPNKIAIANLLEQGSRAHSGDSTGATAKARAMLNVAALRASMALPVDGERSKPVKSVLILGYSTEAVVAAQRLLQLGFSVTMADRGDAARVEEQGVSIRPTTAFVKAHAHARTIDRARLVDADGWLGDFRVDIESPAGRDSMHVGGIVLARPDDPDWVAELREHFKVDVDDNGYARSIDPLMHPAETVDPGIMVMPPRDSATLNRDKVAAADAAAMALLLRLDQQEVVHYRDVSSVDESLCGGCASCVRTCAFGACSIGEDGLSHVDVRRCRGCGKCVVGCPVGARDILSSPHDYILEGIKELAEVETDGDKVLGFLCSGCGYPAADKASELAVEGGDVYPSSFLPIQIPCGGRLDTLYLLEAFKAGFDGICVYRCRDGHCHNLIGNLDMDRRANLLRSVLRSRGIDDSRLRIVDISPNEGQRFVDSVKEMYANIGSLVNGKGGPQ